MSAKRRWKQPDKRVEAAVRMRAAGWSLRKIADHLGVSHQTVANDLGRWESENVDRLLSNLGVKFGAQEPSNLTPDFDAEECQ